MKKRTLCILAIVALFASILLASATSTGFDTTYPSIGDKTVATGSRTASTTDPTFSMALDTTAGDGGEFWMDAYFNGSWVLHSTTFFLSPGDGGNFSYYSSPLQGTSLRLRTGGSLVNANGGKRLKGSVNFG
ncbi:MAG: hypothetical protein LBF64_02315 [Oscillospiraceae bacterium]|jgi:hypothetical protein|nr:hypothetical protein [Oscillospiraceae bacterium]